MIIEFTTDLPKRGRGLWKMNATLLSQPAYEKGIKMIIANGNKKYNECNPALRWEMIKMEIISFSTMLALQIGHKRRQKVEQVERTLSYLLKQYALTEQDKYLDEYYEVKTERDSIMQQQLQSILFHSRAKYYNEGEKNTKYFFGLAKSGYNNKVMYNIYDEAMCLQKCPADVLAVQYRYYKNLYTANKDAVFTLVNRTGNKIPDNNREVLEQKITQNELKAAVMHFKNDKTPGVDGIIAQFYKDYWELIADQLHEAYLYAFDLGELHISARRGVLSLIPKKD